ncbi:MAG: hypothetical protein ACLU99_04140 [Alphaproteobacteria bacterium]
MDDGDIKLPNGARHYCGKALRRQFAYTIDEQEYAALFPPLTAYSSTTGTGSPEFNRLHPNIILNTIEPYSQVKEGEVIAALELTLPIIPQAEVDDLIFRLSGNSELISTVPFAPLKVGLIYAKVQDTKEETRHFTNVVKRLVKEFASYS